MLTLTAQDLDLSASFRDLWYSLDGRQVDRQSFQIDGESGLITTTTTLSQRAITLQFDVLVSDGGATNVGLTTRCPVVVDLYAFTDTITITLCNTTQEAFLAKIEGFEASLESEVMVDIFIARTQQLDNRLA